MKTSSTSLINKIRAHKQQLVLPDALFNQLHQGVAIVNNSLHFIKVNPTFCQLLGFQKDFLLQKSIYAFLFDKQSNETTELIAQLQLGAIKGFQLEKKHSDYLGVITFINIHVNGIYNEAAELTYLLIMLEDVTAHKQTTHHLQKLQINFENIYENAPIGIVLDTGSKGELLNVNHKFCEMLGYSREELKQKTALSITHPEDRSLHLAGYQQLMRGEINSFTFEKRYLKKNASILWAQVSLSLIFDSVRNLKYDIAMIEDITERKKAEQALQENADKYRSIFENSFDAILIFDTQTKKYMEVNEQACQLFLYPKESFYNLSLDHIILLSNILPSSTSTFDLNKYKQLLDKQKRIRFEAFGKKSDQSIFETEVSLAYLSNKQRFIIATIRDISERKRAEKALKKNELKYRDIFENVYDGIVMLDTDANITHLNKAAKEMLEIDPSQEFINVKDIVYEEDQQKSATYFKQLTEQGYYTGYQGRIITKSGLIKYIEVNSNAIYEDGQLVGSRDILRDITERKKVERALEQKIQELERYINSNTQLENFAYVASHDLREPLRTIISFTQLLNHRYGKLFDESGKEFMDYIINATRNMDLLINDLLKYSRVNTQEYHVASINFSQLLDSIITVLGKSIEDKQAKIEICPSLPDIVIANKTKITQLFQNMIANAIKFHKPNVLPVVQINYKAQADYHYFTISDNGIGIKEEYHEKIFHLFRKLHSKGEYEGTGIGLALCKKIVEQHRGDMWVTSEFGEGTTFHFTLQKLSEDSTLARG